MLLVGKFYFQFVLSLQGTWKLSSLQIRHGFIFMLLASFLPMPLRLLAGQLGLKLGSESKGVQYSGHHNIGIALFSVATLQVLLLYSEVLNHYPLSSHVSYVIPNYRVLDS